MMRKLPFIVIFPLLCLIVISADMRDKPSFFTWVSSMPGMDKTGHFILAALLAWSLNLVLSLRQLSVAGRSVPAGTLLAILLLTAEEISQMWFPGRTFDLLDLTADFAGVWASRFLPQKGPAARSGTF